MSLSGPYAWIGWLLLALVPPLIFLLYFLKLRRTKIEVPSTFLWSKTIEDLQVNSLWQRLRSSLLLWLQVLIALLLLLTCLRPGCNATQSVGGRHILLVDVSASMSATDLEGDRLSQAKEQVKLFVEQMQDNDLAMLMTSDDKSQIRQSYTADRALLLRKLQEIEGTRNLTDMQEAIVAASGLSNPSQIRDTENVMTPEQIQAESEKDKATLYVFSDGGFPAVRDSALGQMDVRFVPLGLKKVTNAGIISFNGELSTSNKNLVELFARVENFSSLPINLEIELLRNGNVVDAIRREDVPAGEIISLDFQDQVPSAGREVVEYQLQILNPDQLAADNVAHCVINPGRKPKVMLVTPGNPNLLAALSTSLIGEGLELEVQNAEFLETDGYPLITQTAQYDLVIFDQASPQVMPLANTVFWGNTPPTGWTATPLEPPIFVLFSNNTHPLTSGLALDSLAFLEAKKLTAPPSSTVLLESAGGPIISIAPRDGFQDLVVGFSLVVNKEGAVTPVTDWPSRLSFPVFIHNQLEFLAGLGQKEIQSSIRPGEIVTFRMENAGDQVTIVSPSGETLPVQRQKSGSFIFTAAHQLGIYRVEDNQNQHRLSFAVSLADRRESDIQVKEQFTVGYADVEKSAPIQASADSNFWRYLLLAVFLLVIVEWYIYNRRILM